MYQFKENNTRSDTEVFTLVCYTYPLKKDAKATRGRELNWLFRDVQVGMHMIETSVRFNINRLFKEMDWLITEIRLVGTAIVETKKMHAAGEFTPAKADYLREQTANSIGTISEMLKLAMTLYTDIMKDDDFQKYAKEHTRFAYTSNPTKSKGVQELVEYMKTFQLFQKDILNILFTQMPFIFSISIQGLALLIGLNTVAKRKMDLEAEKESCIALINHIESNLKLFVVAVNNVCYFMEIQYESDAVATEYINAAFASFKHVTEYIYTELLPEQYKIYLTEIQDSTREQLAKRDHDAVTGEESV